MPPYPFWKLEFHGIFVLSDARYDPNVVGSHLEVIPRVREVVLFAHSLLVGCSIDVIVELFSQSLCGNRSKATPKVSQNWIEHLHGTAGAWRGCIVGVGTKAIINAFVRLSATVKRALPVVGEFPASINFCQVTSTLIFYN